MDLFDLEKEIAEELAALGTDHDDSEEEDLDDMWAKIMGKPSGDNGSKSPESVDGTIDELESRPSSPSSEAWNLLTKATQERGTFVDR